MQDLFNKSLNRNLNEVLRALYEFTTLTRLEEAFPNILIDENFFGIAYDALFNDMLAHSMKLFDKHKDSVSFWYMYCCKEKEIETLWRASGSKDKLDKISKDLKHIRDKSHFHIDRKGTIDSEEVWREAGIKPEFLKECLLISYDVLNYIFKLENKNDFPWKPNTYTGDEIPFYIRTLKSNGYL